MTKNVEHAEGGKQHESRIMQRVGHLATQRFGPQPLVSEQFQNVGQFSGALADPHQRHVNGRKQRGMARDRVGEAFAGHDVGADLCDNGMQPADVPVAGKKLQRIVEPRAGLEQQREVAREDGHVLTAGLVEQTEGEVRNRACRLRRRWFRPE